MLKIIDRVRAWFWHHLITDDQLHQLCQDIDDVSRRRWQAVEAERLLERGKEEGTRDVLKALHDLNEQLPQMLETYSQISGQLPQLLFIKPPHRNGDYRELYRKQHRLPGETDSRPLQPLHYQYTNWNPPPPPPPWETGQVRQLESPRVQRPPVFPSIEIELPEERTHPNTEERKRLAEDVASLPTTPIAAGDPDDTQKYKQVESPLIRLRYCEHHDNRKEA